MMIRNYVAMFAVLGLAGCLDAGGPADPAKPEMSSSALSYDLTKAEDRAAWQSSGLSFEGTAGPYAIYRVTGAKQSLSGPGASASVGAVLMGSHYFSSSTVALTSRLYLVSQGGAVLFSATAPQALDGACIGSSVDPTPTPAPEPTTPDPTAFGSGCPDTDTTDGVATAPNPGSGPWGTTKSGPGGSGGSYSNPSSLPGGGWKGDPCAAPAPSADATAPDPAPTTPAIVSSFPASQATALVFEPALIPGDVVLLSKIVIGGTDIPASAAVDVCCAGTDCKAAELGDAVL